MRSSNEGERNRQTGQNCFCNNRGMFGKHAIRLKPAIYERALESARKAGYSSVEEFTEHAIEKELERLETGSKIDTKAEIEKQLRGLGYIE